MSRPRHPSVRRPRSALGLIVAILGILLTALPAAAGVGVLTPKGCVADPAGNVDHCAQTALGLDQVKQVVVSRDGTSVYAAGWYDHALVLFSRNTTTGALTSQGCIADPTNNPDGCTATAKGIVDPYMVAVSRDGTSVYVVSGAGVLARFRRNTTTGALAPRGCVADKGNNPEGCAQTANGMAGANAVAISNDGRSVYVAAYNDNAIVRFDRNTISGKLTPKGCIGEHGDNIAGCKRTIVGGLEEPYIGSVTVSPDGTSVYAAGSAGPSVAVFLRTSTGALKPRGCVADLSNNTEGCPQTAKGLVNPYMAAVSPDGTSVYVADYGTSGVVRFARAKTTGALKPRGCIADAVNNTAGCAVTTNGLAGTQWVAISRDGRSVYAAGTNANAVVRFARNRSTGLLSPKGCVTDTSSTTVCGKTSIGLDHPESLALSNDGRSLYASSSTDAAITRFRRST